MFLNQLNESNKERFLNLCGHAIMADNVVEPEEMEYLALCCYEMEIPNQLPDISESLDDIISDISKDATAYEKKIIAFELIRLFKYDGSYDDEEKAFMKPIIEEFGIDLEKHDKMEDAADKYTKIYDEICDLLTK